MYLGFIPTKASIRLFLRRQVIKSNLEREKCIKKDIIIEVKSVKKRSYKLTSVLVLLMLVLYYMFRFLPSEGVKRQSFGDDNNNETLSVTSRGKQLKKPRPALYYNNVEKNLKKWDLYWHYQDKFLRIFTLKKQKLEVERRNMFTPKPKDPVVSPPPLYLLSTTVNPNFKACEIDHNVTDGNVHVNLSKVNEDLEKVYPMVTKGGFYKPSHCLSRHKVAILVPYRNRTENLRVFLYYIHPFLIAQKLEYRIFVIEQAGTDKFNKGRLFNAGYKEIINWGTWDCVVFHDVDLLPLSPRIMYNCPFRARIMATHILHMHPNGSLFEIKDSSMKRILRFGGVVAMTLKQYEEVNGHSNIYWGWGHEDIDMFLRLRHANHRIVQYSKNVSHYVELPHEQQENKKIKRYLLHHAERRAKYEGLSTSNYDVWKVTLHHLYTHILVDVDPLSHIRDVKDKLPFHLLTGFLPTYPNNHYPNKNG